MIRFEILLLVFKPGDLSWALYLLHCLQYQIDHKTSVNVITRCLLQKYCRVNLYEQWKAYISKWAVICIPFEISSARTGTGIPEYESPPI